MENMFVYIIMALVLTAKGEEDCGILPADSTHLPWSAGVFRNYRNTENTPPSLGWAALATLVSDKAAITAAHKVSLQLNVIRPSTASLYSVAVGVQQWPWLEPEDLTTQYSQVASIHLAPTFRYAGTDVSRKGYVDDIAVLIVEKPFIMTATIHPVCLNFDHDKEKDVFFGKIMLRGLHDPDESITHLMKTTELSTVSLDECIDYETDEVSDVNLIRIITLTISDKICFAPPGNFHEDNKTTPCGKYDEGTGISYAATEEGITRYYFWAVYSTPANNDFDCITSTFYLFTPVLRFEAFLKKLLYPSDETQKTCEVPPSYPEHGKYTSNITRVENNDGKDFYLETLTVACDPGYGVLGVEQVSCYNGYWLQAFPKCVRMCVLKPHPSVVYSCMHARDQQCGSSAPPGTLVHAHCALHYRTLTPLPLMSCSEDGYSDYIAKCVPDCGKVTPQGTQLVYGGAAARRGDLPWHAGVYRKTFRPYQQICGGSLVSASVVISAAHCFWNDTDKQLPAEQFAVAAGKVYRAWDDPADDDDAQKSDVKAIHLPPRFLGSASNYQDDIAVLEVKTSFLFKPHIRPVCLSFDSTFERIQLSGENMGKVAGWGLTSANGAPSPVLQVVELPYVDVGTCIVESPPSFREYITSDKICAGASSKAALCKGDSGGGLAFSGLENGQERYFLRGVVSTAPNNEHACNVAVFTSFTTITKHQEFINRFLND